MPSTLNVTVPLGVPEPGATGAMLAVMLPARTVMVGVVAAWLTTRVWGVAVEDAYIVGSSGVNAAPTVCAPGARVPSAGLVAWPFSTMTGTAQVGAVDGELDVSGLPPGTVAVAVAAWP